MAVTLSSVKASPLPGGEVIVRGLATMDSLYATSGEVMDLSSYLSDVSSPTVLLGSDDGYILRHDRGTNSGGKVLAYNAPAGNSAAALAQAAANTNLAAVVVPFIAIGSAV
jgi:hypothetical protein